MSKEKSATEKALDAVDSCRAVGRHLTHAEVDLVEAVLKAAVEAEKASEKSDAEHTEDK